MDRTDESLIIAHRKGDPAAFGELVRRYADALLGYFVQMTANIDLAEDFFQETFKRVHEKAHTFRSQGRFKPWLFTIATRVAINGLRKRRHLPVLSLNQECDCTGKDCKEPGAVAVAGNWSDPSEQAVKAEWKQQVRQAIELLPARQRATLVLAYFQQLSYRQVAEVMGCSIGTVKTQMYRALRTLAQRLPDISGETK